MHYSSGANVNERCTKLHEPTRLDCQWNDGRCCLYNDQYNWISISIYAKC